MTRVLMMVALLLVSPPAPSSNEESVVGNGMVTSETRELAGFDVIRLDIGVDLQVTIGKATALEIRGEENILPLITTEVKDRHLVIGARKNFNARQPIGMKVTVPVLAGAEIRGSGQMEVTGLASKSFAVAVTGSGDIRLSGESDTLAANVTGSGDILAFDLQARDVSATIQGSGDVKVSASKSLSAVVSGSGDIRYRGEPIVHEVRSGSGEIRKQR